MKNLSYVEISTRNLINNLHEFRKLTNDNICAVVKGNAYGHGIEEVVGVLDGRVEYFQVDDFFEYQKIRDLTSTPILILGHLQETELDEVVLSGGIPGIFSFSQLKYLNNVGRKHNKIIPFQLKVDCQLGRQGFLLEEIFSVFRNLQKLEHIYPQGIYSHLSNLNNTKDLRHTRNQINEFKQAVEISHKFGYENIDTHINSSSGILLNSRLKIKTTISRLGIGLYGLWHSEELKNSYEEKVKLKLVLSWFSSVAQVKKVPENYPIGYDLTFITKRPTKIAIIPQGYSDGFDRRLSNLGEVLVRGKRCKVVGRVAMNMFAVDVSHLKNIKQGDKVTIIGKEGGSEITTQEIAKTAKSINYEIISRISPTLTRVLT